MGSTELAANLFRATQTEEKLKRDEVDNKSQANQTHFEVGTKVRETIKDLGGTMPEDLPTPNQSIPQLVRAKKKLEKDDWEAMLSVLTLHYSFTVPLRSPYPN